MRLGIVAVATCLLLSGISFAQVTNVTNAVSSLCQGITTLLPPAAMLMVLVGAVVYASGQIMGAETRARANVWATAALTGAIIAMLISSVAPPVLEQIYGRTVSCSATASPPSGCVGLGQACGGGTSCCTPYVCSAGRCANPSSSSSS